MGWQWSESKRRYVDVATGDVISRDEIASLQAEFVGKMSDQLRETATALHERGAAPDEWEAALRPILDRTQAISYQLSRGGSNAMTEGDWANVSDLIAAQYDFLNAFAAEAGTGQLSEAEAAARAESYAASGNLAASHGMQATFAGLQLPAQPGDGGTQCLTRCACRWDIIETEDGYEATWLLGGGNNCDGCVGRANEYSPFRQSKEG